MFYSLMILWIRLLFAQKKLNKIEDLGSNLVRVETGANLKDLTDFMRDKNYSGIESLFGIPGSIGGLVYMNGGAFGTEYLINSINRVFDENHQIREIKKRRFKSSI